MYCFYFVDGYVMSGGAICMELLTSDGWSSVYTIEAIIMQISATLVSGQARIPMQSKVKSKCSFQLLSSLLMSLNLQDRAKIDYNVEYAEETFKQIEELHKKLGN